MAKKKDVEEKKTKKSVETKGKKVETKKKDSKKETKKVNKKIASEKDVKVLEEVNKEEIKEVDINENVNVDNSKKKKVIKAIVYSLIAIVIVGALIYSIIESSERNKYFNSITFNEVDELINDDELNIIYWASPNCSYCVSFTPTVKSVSYDKKVTFNYLNTSNLTNDEYASMLTYLGAYDESYSTSGLGTPSIILVQNGAVVNVSVGALSETGLVDYLTTYGFVK